MFHEFALTPDVFDRSTIGADPLLAERLEQLLDDLAETGLVSNLDAGSWRSHIATRLLSVESATIRDRVGAQLKRLSDRRRLVAHPASATGVPSDDLGWLRLARTRRAAVDVQ